MPLRDVRLIVPLIIDDTMMQHLQFVPLAGRVLACLCCLLVLVADGGAQTLVPVRRTNYIFEARQMNTRSLIHAKGICRWLPSPDLAHWQRQRSEQHSMQA